MQPTPTERTLYPTRRSPAQTECRNYGICLSLAVANGARDIDCPACSQFARKSEAELAEEWTRIAPRGRSGGAVALQGWK